MVWRGAAWCATARKPIRRGMLHKIASRVVRSSFWRRFLRVFTSRVVHSAFSRAGRHGQHALSPAVLEKAGQGDSDEKTDTHHTRRGFLQILPFFLAPHHTRRGFAQRHATPGAVSLAHATSSAFSRSAAPHAGQYRATALREMFLNPCFVILGRRR